MIRRALQIILLVGLARSLCAQKLPVRSYGLTDGLSHENVHRIVADSRGFVWFCTYDGLSRFDGERFTNYGIKDGLPVASVEDLLEARDGTYWIATKGGGVARFDPDARKKSGTTGALFKIYSLGSEAPSNFVASLREDRQGDVWATTNGGLFRLKSAERHSGVFRRVELKLPSRPDVVAETQSIAEDREGSIWVGTLWGLVRLLPSGHITHYVVNPSADDVIFAMIIDQNDRIWLGHRTGLFVFKPETAAEAEMFSNKTRRLPQAYSYTTANGLPNNRIQAIVQANDGHIWIGTSFGGLSEFDGQRFRNYGARQRLSNRISDLAEDRSGNIWVGTPDKGAMRIAKDGLISYGEEEGITNPEVIQIYESPDGELYAISSKWSINRFDGARFTTVHPNLPKRIIDSSSGRWPIIQSRNGEWWVSTIEGLYRFPKVKHLEDLAHTPPLAVYTKRDGLPDNNINRLFEDSPGDIWISSYNPTGLLTRWDRATATFHVYSQAHGIPPLNWTNVFGEAGGHVWLGLHNEGVARHRQGRFEIFTPSNGVPSGIIQGIYQDRKGGLWIASSGGGAARVSDPDAAKPVFRTYQVEDGLSSNNLRSFVEDIWGRVYIGTAKGVDRLDPSTGRIRHYTRTEGLIASEVTAAFADRSGRLWFGTREGVSILIPAADRPQSPPPVWIRAVSIDGVSQTVSELGETSVSGFELTPQQSGIQIEFASPDSGGAATTRYQYHLEGTGADWSSPADQHFISFAHLSPGRYRFLVRAVTADGLHSDPPSSVTFTVLPPIWRRWWSLSLITIAIGAAIYGLHRYQMRRVLEIERIRMRIATDLHDDIGLNLSRMVILSEVVKQQIGNEHRETVEHLTQIADSARGLVDSMSDIVWSIDPRRDDLHNLLLRIRQFASGVFEAQGIRWDLHAEQELEKVKLTPSQRREILLVLKEALNNIARHAYCSIASVTIAIIGNQLIAEVRDNGRGFSGTDGDGNGLKNMRERAARLGGSLSVSSSPGRGTTLRLMVPMKQERMNMRWRSRKRGVR